MKRSAANHNSLGKLYHDQKGSLKKTILEDLHEKGIKNGKIGHWLRKITDEKLPNMPGNMQDTFIQYIPESATLLKPEPTYE